MAMAIGERRNRLGVSSHSWWAGFLSGQKNKQVAGSAFLKFVEQKLEKQTKSANGKRNIMKSLIQIISVAAVVIFASGCGGQPEVQPSEAPEGSVFRNVTAMEAKQLIEENSNLVVLDVRTPEEFQNGHIKGARNINFHGPRFNEQLNALEKDQAYLLHCQSGGRSSTTVDEMKSMDFMQVYHLQGGLSSWEEAGYETVQ